MNEIVYAMQIIEGFAFATIIEQFDKQICIHTNN